jgi:steroid 5-alpha reductase family enzyme
MVLVDLLLAFIFSLIAAVAFMSAMFAVGRRIHRYDIVDIAWGLVFIVVAVTSLLFNQNTQLASLIVCSLVVIWGVRLSSHILRRVRSTTVEDKRYVEMRKKWQSGNEDLAIYFRIYVTQALLAMIISLPVIVINVATVEVSSALLIVGVLLWTVGFSIEAIADKQLRHFIQNPQNKGHVMTSGMWRYSRHPNYFGELTQWWAIGLIALALPFGWIGLIGPIIISYLIIFVSGIPLTEKAFAGRNGWSQYKRQTSVLIPWFVRKN